MKTLLSFLFALFILASCGGREDDPTPTPAPTAQISSNLVGSWRVMKKKNVSGYIENTDASLYITVSANKLNYKLQNGGVFDGTGTIENSSNADQVTLTNGTKLTMFKTVQSDGTQNFYFVHPNGLTDDIMVKKN